MQLYLITGYKNFYGQSRKPWVSIDTLAFMKYLQQAGISVNKVDWHDLASGSFHPRDSLILYTFSQIAHIRAWLKDQMSILASQNRILPSLPLLLAHENKGYAQLYLQKLGIDAPQSWYLCHPDDIPAQISYPVVLKSISGSNGKGVFLCESKQELLSRIEGLSPAFSPFIKLDHLRRRYLRNKRRYEGYSNFEAQSDADAWLEYMRPGVAFILQQYIPGLDSDYRVIAIGERFYLMMRRAKKGDFRASGTKDFDFDASPPQGLLDYAEGIYQQMDTPFLSMDIGYRDGKCYLFEYQASHYGTGAIVRSKGYYQKASVAWEFVKGESILEQVLALGLAEYLRGAKLDGGFGTVG